MHLRTCLILIWFGLAANLTAADEITSLKPMHLQTSLESAAIVVGATHGEIAKHLQRRIKDVAGIALPILSDADAAGLLKAGGNLIALGQFGDNRFIEYLYNRGYVIVDGMQPGAGGHALLTVHNPDGRAVNVIVAGGDVERACDELVARIKAHGKTLPRLYDITLGAGAQIVERYGAAALDPKRTWPTNMMNIQEALGELAMLYVYTGQEKYAVAFKERFTAWLESGNFAGASDDFFRPIVSWDLVEESPSFSDAERLWITRKLWEVTNALRPQWESYVFSRKDQHKPRRNHGARSAISVYFAARYFHQYYNIPEMSQWLADVDQYWAPQMTSFMAAEGTDQAIATLMPATMYALAENKTQFLSRDVLGMIAAKPYLKSRSYYFVWGNYGVTWLNLAAHRFDRPDYLRAVIGKYGSVMNASRFPNRSVRELGRSFFNGRLPPPEAAPSGDWLMSRPLSKLFHENVDVLGPRNVEYDKAFDFLVFRDPLRRERQYLELRGQNAGSYSNDAGNAINELFLGGAGWIDAGWWIMQTTRHTASVAIARDGKSTPVPAFVQLDRAQVTSDGLGFTRSGYIDYNGADWFRNIINLPNEWFLVIDEITAKQAGDLTLESRWPIGRACVFDGDDVLACAPAKDNSPLFLRIAGTGWQSQSMSPRLYRDLLHAPPHPFPRRMDNLSRSTSYRTEIARRWTGHLAEGRTHTFANLLHVSASKTPKYTLHRHGEGYLVSSGSSNWSMKHDGEKWQVQTTEEKPRPTSPQVSTQSTDLKPTWRHQESARVLCSAVIGDRYGVGLADGRIRLRDSDGTVTTDVKMPGMVFGLCAVDLDGDGIDEFVAGSDAGLVHAYSADGSPRWQFKTGPWKRPAGAREGAWQPRTVVTSVAPCDIDGDKKPEILAAGIYWYILDRNGQLKFTHETDTSGVSWDAVVKDQIYTVTPGDITGDGQDEIVGDLAGVGSAGGSSIIHVWDGENPKYIWRHSRPNNRFCGSALKSVVTADFDGDGADEFAIASDAYSLHVGYFDNLGPAPHKVITNINVGSGANTMIGADLTGDGKAIMIIGTEMGHVHAIDHEIKRVFLADVGESVYSLAAANGQVWVGTSMGNINVLNREGAIIHRADLGDIVDHLVADKMGNVLATTAGGAVALFRVD